MKMYLVVKCNLNHKFSIHNNKDKVLQDILAPSGLLTQTPNERVQMENMNLAERVVESAMMMATPGTPNILIK